MSKRKYTARQNKHHSEALKVWWSKLENKERMRLAHRGHHNGGWHHSKVIRKKISEGVKRYWRDREEVVE